MSDTCRSFEPLLSAWVDGELGRGDRASVGAHLQRCARCRAEVHELRVTQSMLRSLPTRRMPVAVLDGAAQGGRHRDLGVVRRVAARTSVAAATLVAVVAAAGFMAGSQPRDRTTVAVPVDVYVADHLVRAVGGAVSTPALVDSDGERTARDSDQ